jgi:3-oxoacyl-[acyl-carrier-protein] synthase-1
MRVSVPEIVVTGAGLGCNLGHDPVVIQRILREGRAVPFTRWGPAVEYGARCQLIGLYPHELSANELGVDKSQSRFMGRASLLALVAARNALEQARLERRDIALVVGSGTGDVTTFREIEGRLTETRSARRVSPTVIPRIMASTTSANLATHLGITGPSFTASAACAGGAYNLLLAAELIRGGHVDAALAGGVEVADLHFYAGFDSMRAYNCQDNDHPERASRPYAADRAGFIFAEGAGMLVLETRQYAEARGANVLGILKGFGMSSDGSGEMVAPSSEGAYAAMRRALERSGVGPSEIDYVNTHGTSTPLGDLSEVRALKRLLDERHVAYSSTKGYTGHTVSAAGAIEAIFTLAMLRDGWVAPSVNADPLDPELTGYPPVLEPRNQSLRVALSNSFGFGGTNVTLVLAREGAD